MAMNDKRPGARRLLAMAAWPLLVCLASCDSSGDNANGNGVDDRPQTSGGTGPVVATVNVLGTWSANFTPERCQDNLHTGSATFFADPADTTQIAATTSRIELTTYGCSSVGTGLSGLIIFRVESPYPAEITLSQFEELLNEQLSVDGDLSADDEWTVEQFNTSTISFRRMTNTVDCDEGENVDCGLFELTR
jgi:hypothetical protein